MVADIDEQSQSLLVEPLPWQRGIVAAINRSTPTATFAPPRY